jgi:c-di-AMP phosphodiesterase-like protein
MQIEHPRGGVKLSLRTDGTVDASKIMGSFGGGGHVNRAGTHLKQENFIELVETMVMMIKKEFE